LIVLGRCQCFRRHPKVVSSSRTRFLDSTQAKKSQAYKKLQSRISTNDAWAGENTDHCLNSIRQKAGAFNDKRREPWHPLNHLVTAWVGALIMASLILSTSFPVHGHNRHQRHQSDCIGGEICEKVCKREEQIVHEAN